MKSERFLYVSRSTAWSVLSALSFLLLTGQTIFGQQETKPVRGFDPAGSYGLSSIESINTTNGNVMLSFPFKLPAGRNGFAGQLGLHYDSKDLDSYVVDWSGPPNYLPIYRAVLGPSDQGGWHYGLNYGLQLTDRRWSGGGSSSSESECPDVNIWQVRMTLPDGSVHEMIPRGWNSFQGGEGFYRIKPGGQATCVYNGANYYVVEMPYSTGTITYYSFDGSYLKVDWQPDGNWTLYLGDGTRVTGCTCYNSGGQRIYDRNNNYLQIDNITYNDKPATQISDQLGRAIIWESDYTTSSDYIHVTGVGGAPLTYQIKWAAINVNKRYQPEYAAGGGPAGDEDTFWGLAVVSEIDLPVESGGLKYVFGYNAPYSPDEPTPANGWGELSSVTLPSGAQAQYHYALDGLSDLYTHEAMQNSITQKTLTSLQENDGNSTPVSETTSYNISEFEGSGAATITNPDGGVVYEMHSLNRTISIQHPDGTLVERIWQQNRPQNHPTMTSFDYYNYNIYDPQRVNNYVKTEFTSIKDAAGNFTKTAIKDFTYDKNNNPISVTEYDWVDYASVPRDGSGRPTGIPGNAVVKRITTNAFARFTPDASDSYSNYPDSYWNGSSPPVRSAIAATEISDGSQIFSRAEFFYDDPATTANLLQQTTWDSTKGAYSNPLTPGNSTSTSNQYDSWSSGATGRLIQSTDARGVSTRCDYGAVNGFDLYPTQVQTAYQTSVQRTETREYDFSTGLVTRVTDADNNVATSTSYDVFGRPTLVRAAEGKPEETRTVTEYSDTLRRVIVRSDLNAVGDAKLVDIQHYDQLGRIRLTRQLEDSVNQSAIDETTGIKVQTRYAFSGANYYEVTSNAYRAGSSGGAGDEPTMGWTRTRHDQGGRVVEIQTFAGPGLPAPWGSNSNSTGAVTTAYNANEVTVTDQAGKARKSVTDGLGRLAQVYEDPAGLNYSTSYNYDPFDDLVSVNQGAQTRSFVYDSLKRLSSATNPESGTVSYLYDNNGNLTQRTDARGVVSGYAYDALDRVTSRSYNDGTPAVSYAYDSTNVSYGRGRLAAVSSSVSSYSYTSYDALGRALSATQSIGSQNYSLGYSYDRAGHVLTQTYPSGRTVTNVYDTAGRTSSVSGNLGDGASRTYSIGINYAPGGQMTQEQFGTATPVYNKLFYNSRQQLTEIRESTTANDLSWNRGALINSYGGANNNGNLIQQDLYIPHDDQVSSYTLGQTSYVYDGLNRIIQANDWAHVQPPDCPSQCSAWSQAYQYDRYGNRTIDPNWTWGMPKQQFTVDTNTNRLGVPGGQSGAMTYDAAGNLIGDSYTGQGARVYDAENRMIQAQGGLNNGWQYYAYDGDGHRVKRNVDGGETWQVYGTDGDLVAEYAAGANPDNPQKEYGYRNDELLVTAEPNANVHWLVGDQLGTPRMILDSTGSLSGVSRHDYLPFGEELFAGVNWRTTGLGYTSGDQVRQKFTRKERDNETGLDYFEVRYYSSAQGRFTSPDEFSGGPDELYEFEESASDNPTFYADTADPQSLNKYQYGYNNPLRFVDEDGHQAWEKLKSLARSAAGTANRTINGASSALAEDNGLGPNQGAQNRTGRAIGHVVALLQGGAEIVGGALIAEGGGGEAVVTAPACASGAGCVVPAAGVGTAVVGAAVATHGTLVTINTVRNIFRKNSNQTSSGSNQTKSGEVKPKRDRSLEGTRTTRENIEHAQKVHRKAGRPDRIRDTSKSRQNERTELRKIRNLKDAEKKQ